jgi:hypothetical protein
MALRSAKLPASLDRGLSDWLLPYSAFAPRDRLHARGPLAIRLAIFGTWRRSSRPRGAKFRGLRAEHTTQAARFVFRLKGCDSAGRKCGEQKDDEKGEQNNNHDRTVYLSGRSGQRGIIAAVPFEAPIARFTASDVTQIPYLDHRQGALRLQASFHDRGFL